mgnify:FL=1
MIENLLQNPEQITFAVLFVGLLIYVVRTNDAREEQYRETISRLTMALGTVEDIEEKIDRLSNKLDTKKVG